MKEAKKEMGIQSVQVKKLEGDFKNEVGITESWQIVWKMVKD